MVQQEVVVGTPDALSLDASSDPTHHQTDAMPAVTMQPITIQLHQPLTTTIPLEEVHALQVQHQREQLSQVEVVEEFPRKQKKMLFMTNYRDYTITDTNGRISIGEKKYMQEACKMVPVTDVSTGHKFEYQYRLRGTVRRFEDKRMVIYFIGQISNERILALFYQTVFQLVCKVGKIDLDKDYTSGKRVLSTYYSAFGPSKARTIRTPIEKLTYMKLLIVGDVEDEECEDNVIILDDDDGAPVQPSEKLKRSKTFKKSEQKRGKKFVKTPKGIKKETQKEESSLIEPQPTLSQDQTPSTVPVIVKRPRGRPPKKRLAEMLAASAGAGDGPGLLVVRDGQEPEDQSDPSTPTSAMIWLERGSSKRKVKRPSRLSDYYDFTKKNKMDAGSDEEVGESSDKEYGSSAEVTSPKKDSTVEKSTPDDPKESESDTALLQNEEMEASLSDMAPDQAAPEEENLSETHSTEKEIEPIDEGEVNQEVTDPDVEYSPKPKVGRKKKHIVSIPRKKPSVVKKYSPVKTVFVPVNEKIGDEIVTRIVERKKRGRGRPRKYPKDDEIELDTDLLPPPKRKYPSCQFQRANNLKRYLCQACLTNHESPVEDGESADGCHIINPKHSFKDQTATTNTASCALMSLPTSLSVKVAPETRKLTVCAGQDIQAYTEFGPLVGILLSEDDIQIDTDLSHVWFLQQEDDSEKFYLYTGDENASNWCHYLTPVPPGVPYNMVMVLREEGIFFTASQRITAGSEFKVYMPYFGNKSRPVAAMTQSECLHCKRSFQSSLDYQKHYHIFHPGGFTKQKQKCRLCNLSFPGMKDLQAHMNEKHEGVGAFQCDQCPRYDMSCSV